MLAVAAGGAVFEHQADRHQEAQDDLRAQLKTTNAQAADARCRIDMGLLLQERGYSPFGISDIHQAVGASDKGCKGIVEIFVDKANGEGQQHEIHDIAWTPPFPSLKYATPNNPRVILSYTITPKNN